ncbi:hypothetical protein [Halodesulfurarchaeum formicicum]|uniref:Uncharacterized protein n=1 Tax=Halodesulfurarchaeum formicicum TaxID=1873524 RepID=A0A1J1ABB2_9EURY|nr:hypothetical protein [Halodesulfurarchaeum formicicum]APE95426.1 hypothetical protein HSR6_0973 [Halodesulfurarchaeum formicicum]
MKARTFIAALFAVLLLGSMLAVPAVAQDVDEQDYTLSELKSGGTQLPNSPDSVRSADGRMYWAIHWPADAMLANPGDSEDDDWKFLSPGETVERNAIYLRTILQDEASEEMTVKVAYWREGEREVQQGNETVAEPYVKDLVVDTHEVSFEKGWAMQEISLRKSQEPRQVTVWAEGHEDDLRWTFTHESVATSQAAGIQTEGDYLTRASFEFVLPIIVGVFLVGSLVAGALRRAGKGPGWGYVKWAFTLAIGSALILATQFSSVTEILVNAPRILAALVVAIVGIVMLETYTTNVSHTAFFRPVLDKATSPSGEEAVDIIDLEEREEKTVKMPDGSTAVVRDGLIPFLARIFGGAARLERSEELKTRMELTDSPIDEMVWVHPDAEEILDYQPEGWGLELPEPETRGDWLTVLVGGAVLLAVAQMASATFGGGIGMLAFLGAVAVATVRPQDGHARVEPAPAHLRSAWASMLYLSVEAEDADTIEDARDTIVSLQARSEKDVQEALQEQDSTLIEEMFSEDVDRSGDLIDPLPERETDETEDDTDE